MIFVILGLGVLAVSFVFALASLVKEQSKLSQMIGEEEAQDLLKKNGVKKAKAVGLKPSTVTQPQTVQSQQLPEPILNRPLFPWEEDQYKGTKEDLLEADRRKVEELRTQLRALKSRAQMEVQSSGAGLVEASAQVVTKGEPVPKYETSNLSGEISSEDIRGVT